MLDTTAFCIRSSTFSALRIQASPTRSWPYPWRGRPKHPLLCCVELLCKQEIVGTAPTAAANTCWFSLRSYPLGFRSKDKSSQEGWLFSPPCPRSSHQYYCYSSYYYYWLLLYIVVQPSTVSFVQLLERVPLTFTPFALCRRVPLLASTVIRADGIVTNAVLVADGEGSTAFINILNENETTY